MAGPETPPTETPAETQPGAAGTRKPPGVAATVALYTLARLVLLGALTGLLMLAGVPVLLALLLALVVALPLSMLVFRGLRSRLDAALADVSRRRVAERADLRARLRGEAGGSDPAADHPAAERPTTHQVTPDAEPAAEATPPPSAGSEEQAQHEPHGGRQGPGE